MINSLFVLNRSGEVITERHWQGHDRSVVETFWTAYLQAPNNQIEPVLVTPKNYIFHVARHGMFFVAPVTAETQPLVVLELLNRIVTVFEEYLGATFSEEQLRDNFVIIYQVLEEMLDNGYPFTTEAIVLKDIVRPPTILNRMISAMSSKGSVSSTMPEGSASVVWWRRSGIKYTNNEIFFDIIEELDAIVESNGSLTSAEVVGRIVSNCRLGGMPDVLLSFRNAGILDNLSFHPCVRHSRFDQDRTLSFIPPDGVFELISYRAQAPANMPLSVSPSVTFSEGTGRVEIVCNARLDRPLDDVAIVVRLPPEVENASSSTEAGRAKFDSRTKELRWELGKLVVGRMAHLSASLTTANGVTPDASTSLSVHFKLPQTSISGLQIESVQIPNEKYKPYKGVKATSKSGNFQIRC